MQATLFEQLKAEKIETEYVEAIPVNQILAPDDAIEPDDDLVADVAQHGVIEPLVLRPFNSRQTKGKTRYAIVSGRRRYLAAVKTDTPTVRALITRCSNAQESVLTMRLHKLRAENFVADVRAIEKLLAEQLSEKEIGDLTGLKQQEIDRRKRLVTADKRIIEAVLAGRARINVAEAAAKLPPNQQRKLMDSVGEQPLKSSHIAEIKTAQSEKAVKALPQTLFESPSPQETAPAGIERFAGEMWELLLEMEATGMLNVQKPKSGQQVTNARVVANTLIEHIRTATAPKEFSPEEGERLQQEALAKWNRNPVPTIKQPDDEDQEALKREYASRGANESGVYLKAEMAVEFKFQKASLSIRVAQDKQDQHWRSAASFESPLSGWSWSPRVDGDICFTRDQAIETQIIQEIERLRQEVKRRTRSEDKPERTRLLGLIEKMQKWQGGKHEN